MCLHLARSIKNIADAAATSDREHQALQFEIIHRFHSPSMVESVRIAAGIAAIVFSALGTMMLHHNAVKRPDSVGIGASVGLLMVALIAFVEFVRRL